MKRKYGVMIATWILWFISILVPLFCVVLKRVPQRVLTVQFLVILLLGILLCVQWIWLRRAERLQNTAIRGEIEGAGMAALQSMTVPVILAMRTGEILWCNEIFRSRFEPLCPGTLRPGRDPSESGGAGSEPGPADGT